MNKISIVIPARNEDYNLTVLIPKIESVLNNYDYEIIIVNDGSIDNTQTIINNLCYGNKRIIPVKRICNHGFGNAVKEGYKNSSGDIVILMMGDLSDDPEDIPKLITKIEEGWDIVYGSRFLNGNHTHGYPIIKMIANRFFNNIIKILFLTTKTDTTNAFKAYKKEVLNNIDIESSGFDITIEVALKSMIVGYNSTEVEVTWNNRVSGEAKLKLMENATKYGLRLIKLFIMNININVIHRIFK